MRVLRVAFFFILVLPFAVLLAVIGYFARPRQRDEEAHDDAAPIVAGEEIEDAELEKENDDRLFITLASFSPTNRGKLIRKMYGRQRFTPRLPWIR